MTKKRDLVIVTPSLARVGGTEIYVSHAIRAARASGWRVRALVHARGDGDALEAAAQIPVGGLISKSTNPARLARRRREVRALARSIAARADVVAFHGLPALDLVEALSSRVPTLVSAHTTELTCPAGVRFLRTSRSLCSRTAGPACLAVDRRERCLTTARNERFPLAQKLLVLTRTGSSRLLAARASMMLFNSEAMRADFETHVGRPRRSRVIHPPFERAIVERVDAPPRDLAFVGRLIGMKGADDAVRVSAKIGVPLDVYGDGPERDRCEGLARELDAEVHFHGWVDRREVNTALARAGCLLVPSRSFEAFGQVGPQALSAGCPAVAYDVGGVRAWCLEGMSSVVAAGDVDAMARAADEWLARRRAGLDVSAWSSTIDERFGHARFAREYTAVLEELAA